MTPLEAVYDAFLATMLEDEWQLWEDYEVQQDLRALLSTALPQFRFPRVDLTIEGDSFVGELNNTEIQILARYMKCEWLNRSILTWENIKPLYEERDFSMANMLDKLYDSLAYEKKEAKRIESIYYRSIDNKPFDYSKLAGDR
jgi:hypothetical protein